MPIVYSLLCAAISNIFIYVMTTFINGQFLPHNPVMALVYAKTAPFHIYGFYWVRLAIALPTTALLANTFFPLAYRFGGPGIGGVGCVAFSVLFMVTTAFMLNPALRLSWPLAAAVLLMLASSAWVAWMIR